MPIKLDWNLPNNSRKPEVRVVEGQKSIQRNGFLIRLKPKDEASHWPPFFWICKETVISTSQEINIKHRADTIMVLSGYWDALSDSWGRFSRGQLVLVGNKERFPQQRIKNS